jgi:hypothetical protein
VLDAGALIALERGDRRLQVLFRGSFKGQLKFCVPTGVLAQVWRDGVRQPLLARFLKLPAVKVLPLSEAHAKAAGALCGRSGTDDVIDASVVVCAQERGCPVVTSDPKDLRALDPALEIYSL